jgi:hypothetical protein
MRATDLNQPMQLIGDPPNFCYFEKCSVVECVIVRMVSKKTDLFGERFQILPEHSILFL